MRRASMREREEKREAAGSGESNCRWILKKLREDFFETWKRFSSWPLCACVDASLYFFFECIDWWEQGRMRATSEKARICGGSGRVDQILFSLEENVFLNLKKRTRVWIFVFQEKYRPTYTFHRYQRTCVVDGDRIRFDKNPKCHSVRASLSLHSLSFAPLFRMCGYGRGRVAALVHSFFMHYYNAHTYI